MRALSSWIPISGDPNTTQIKRVVMPVSGKCRKPKRGRVKTQVTVCDTSEKPQSSLSGSLAQPRLRSLGPDCGYLRRSPLPADKLEQQDKGFKLDNRRDCCRMRKFQDVPQRPDFRVIRVAETVFMGPGHRPCATSEAQGQLTGLREPSHCPRAPAG